MDFQEFDWDRLHSLGYTEKATGELKEACWKGYTAVGTKQKNGKTVPNCVPVKKKKKLSEDHGEQFDINAPNALNDMAMGNALPKVPATGPVKNPQMGEQKIRMPRMEDIVESSNKNGKLAMMAAPNYSEDDFEPNGAMAINQLRVIREKVDIMLGMLYPDDNLEPWMATKLATAGQSLASVADYMRFGVEL